MTTDPVLSEADLRWEWAVTSSARPDMSGRVVHLSTGLVVEGAVKYGESMTRERARMRTALTLLLGRCGRSL